MEELAGPLKAVRFTAVKPLPSSSLPDSESWAASEASASRREAMAFLRAVRRCLVCLARAETGEERQ